jgi:hypothetical protein
MNLRQTSNLKWLRLNEVTAKQNNQLAISSIALAIPPVERIQTRRRVKTLRREHTRIIARRNFRFQTSSSLNIQYNHKDKLDLVFHSFFLHSSLVKLRFVVWSISIVIIISNIVIFFTLVSNTLNHFFCNVFLTNSHVYLMSQF